MQKTLTEIAEKQVTGKQGGKIKHPK